MTRKEYIAQVRRDLIKQGRKPIKAAYDSAGNCDLCGECGRCPGWHYAGETFPRFSEPFYTAAQGRKDSARGLHARSANGIYLDGFYSVKREVSL